MRLLLDTQVLLWWLSDDRKLPKNARDIIANPGNDMLVSSASVWEISIKTALGRLEIELDDLENACAKQLSVVADRISACPNSRPPASHTP